MEKDEQVRLCRLLLSVGKSLLECGAEVHRVEDTLRRIARSAGATHANIFVITSAITITLGFGEEELLTHTRRINHASSVDFHVLETVNSLSRQFCSGALDIAGFEQQLHALDRPCRSEILYLGSALAAGGFTVFFGGSLPDALVAAIIAFAICAFQLKVSHAFPNRVIYYLSVSFLTGLVIWLSARFLPMLDAGKIMIGDIMLLTPGVAITNATRDALVGDTISGTMRLVESVLWAGALAFGFMAAMWVTGV